MTFSKIILSLLVLCLVTYTCTARLLEFSTGTRGIYKGELSMGAFTMDVSLDPPAVSFKCTTKADNTACPVTKVSNATVTIGADYVLVSVPASGSAADKCSQVPAFQYGVESIVESNGISKGFLVVYYNQQNVTIGERCITVDATKAMVGIDWINDQNCVALSATTTAGCTSTAADQAATSFVVAGTLSDREVLPEPSPSATPSTMPSTSGQSSTDPSHSHADSSTQPRDSSKNTAARSYLYSAVAVAIVIGTIIVSHLNILKQ